MKFFSNFKPLDSLVGKRIKYKRLELNLNQKTLSDPLQITIQQFQKYETGVNRISSGKLFVLAQLLNVELNYFFDLEPNSIFTKCSKLVLPITSDTDKEKQHLIHTFFKIKDLSVRKHLLDLCEILSK